MMLLSDTFGRIDGRFMSIVAKMRMARRADYAVAMMTAATMMHGALLASCAPPTSCALSTNLVHTNIINAEEPISQSERQKKTRQAIAGMVVASDYEYLS